MASGTDQPATTNRDQSSETETTGKTLNKNLFGYLVFVFILSVATNILLLVSPFYMIQVYDRVLTSSSYSTLLSLSLIAVFLLIIFAFAEAGRRRALAMYGRYRMDSHFKSIGKWLLSKERFSRANLKKDTPGFQDITRVQSALSSGTILPLFDLPFTPLFLGMLFLLHPVVGAIGLGGAVLLVIIAIVSEMLTSKRHSEDQQSEAQSVSFINEVGKASNAVISMGMRARVLDRWLTLKDTSNDASLSTSSLTGFLTGLSKSMRQILQTAVLGTGAYLALKQEMSPGAIIAGSIIMGRGLAPIDQIVGSWKQMALVHNSWKKLTQFAKEGTEIPQSGDFRVQTISSGLTANGLAVMPLGATKPILQGIQLNVAFGQTMAIIGPSGSGKSTLLQTLSGVWPILAGEVKLGNRPVGEWDDEDRGRFVGYLPQRIELLPGTIADNISRFQPDRSAEVEEVANILGYHELFMSLPQGFSTIIGEKGQGLSAGQRQAVGLARAFFGDARVLLLDEPTANLDIELSKRFAAALGHFKAKGVGILLTTHDFRLLPTIEKLYNIDGNRLVEVDNSARNKGVRPISAARQG